MLCLIPYPIGTRISLQSSLLPISPSPLFKMRTALCLLGFIGFGMVLFFILGDALVERSWLDAFGQWTWLVAVALLVADIFLPIPTTLIITVMGQKYGPILGGLIGTLGSFSA